MESVYIETTVVSYLVATPPAGTLAHQWQVPTCGLHAAAIDGND